MSFEQFSFDARIESAIRAVGFTTPTPIQLEAIPHVLKGDDLLGLAQTGTGKTAAFVLPLLQHLTKGPLRRTRALILAPTRELAEQIHLAIRDFGKETKIRSMTIYGGVGKGPQISGLRRGIEIVVACPGRLLDLIGEGYVDLSHLEVLVLDEADRMCDMGFLPDVRRILGYLPAQRQTLFFSATMPDDIRTLSKEILNNPATVQIGLIAPAKTVSHALYPVPSGLKKQFLLSMLEKTPTGRVLIFTRTKRRARALADDLSRSGYRASALQGNMTQNRRQEAIDGFRAGHFDILVATDIASRGIDVEEISHVINFDMPDTVDAYTHRIGRTGRAEQSGEAFSFFDHEEEAMVREIERTLNMKIERRRLDDFNYGSSAPAPAQSERRSGRSNQSPAGNGAAKGANNGHRRSNGSTGSGGKVGGGSQPSQNDKAGSGAAQSEGATRRRRFRQSGQGGQGRRGQG